MNPDVYKRQVYVQFVFVLGALMLLCAGFTYPVSYTHLDVYKRQAMQKIVVRTLP